MISFYTRAVAEHYTASSSSSVLEQARRSKHDTSRHDSPHTSCLLCRDVSRTSGIWLKRSTEQAESAVQNSLKRNTVQCINLSISELMPIWICRG